LIEVLREEVLIESPEEVLTPKRGPDGELRKSPDSRERSCRDPETSHERGPDRDIDRSPERGGPDREPEKVPTPERAPETGSLRDRRSSLSSRPVCVLQRTLLSPHRSLRRFALPPWVASLLSMRR